VSPAEIRALLDRHGLVARKDLGQNFLADERVAAKLADLAQVGPGDAVLEIGCGLGVLTRALAARAERMVTLEIDAGIVRLLRAEASLPANVELVHADALRCDLAALVASLGPRVRVVANLPYSISAPALRRLLDLRARLAGWSVMLQREVAARLLAAPGSREYGSLGVLHRLAVRVERCLELPPAAFFPEPRVRSRFLRMTPLAVPALGPGELEAVEALLRRAFGQRRKTLRGALREAAGPEVLARALAAAGVDPRLRAEALAPERLLALARALREAT